MFMGIFNIKNTSIFLIAFVSLTFLSYLFSSREQSYTTQHILVCMQEREITSNEKYFLLLIYALPIFIMCFLSLSRIPSALLPRMSAIFFILSFSFQKWREGLEKKSQVWEIEKNWGAERETKERTIGMK